MEGVNAAELCPCLVLMAFDSLLPCEPAVPATHRHKGTICTNSPIRKEGTSEEEGGGRDHTS